MDFNLIRRAAVNSHGGRRVVRELTTRQMEQSAALSLAIASGAWEGGEDLEGDGTAPTFVFGLTPCTSPYIVR